MGEVVTALDSDALYERYGKSLEQAEQGKYVAISQDGRIIVDVDDVLVVDQAIREFGSGNFIFRRIGYSYVDKVRRGEEGECSPARIIRISRYK